MTGEKQGNAIHQGCWETESEVLDGNVMQSKLEKAYNKKNLQYIQLHTATPIIQQWKVYLFIFLHTY